MVSLGLGDQARLEECLIACADVGPTVVLVQAPGLQRESFEYPNITVEPMTDAASTIARLGGAGAVLTGRMHVLLTCIALGVPTIFLGGWYDSRYSLIEHLRVPVEPPVPVRIRTLVGRVLDGLPRSTRPSSRVGHHRRAGGVSAPVIRLRALERDAHHAWFPFTTDGALAPLLWDTRELSIYCSEGVTSDPAQLAAAFCLAMAPLVWTTGAELRLEFPLPEPVASSLAALGAYLARHYRWPDREVTRPTHPARRSTARTSPRPVLQRRHRQLRRACRAG